MAVRVGHSWRGSRPGERWWVSAGLSQWIAGSLIKWLLVMPLWWGLLACFGGSAWLIAETAVMLGSLALLPFTSGRKIQLRYLGLGLWALARR